MHENQWHGIASEVRALCAKPEYNIVGELKWLYFGRHNTAPDNSVKHLSQEVRDKFRREFYSIITKRKSLKIIACVASCAAAYRMPYIKTEEDLYKHTYKPVSERFQYHLQDLGRFVGDKQLGLVVADHRGRKQDELFRDTHLDMVGRDSLFVSSYPNFVESIFLSPSHHSIGIQIADMVVGAIGRKFNNNDSTFFDLLIDSFRANARGDINGFGLVKFPKIGWE